MSPLTLTASRPSRRSPVLGVSIAVRSRSGAGRCLEELIDAAVSPAVVIRMTSGGLIIGGITSAELTAVLAAALRGHDIAVAVLLDRQSAALQMLAPRALDRAARRPLRIEVDAPPGDQRRTPLLAALELGAAVMRRRTPAMWDLIDLLATCNGNAEQAARTLGCAGQTLRERRSRAHVSATANLPALLGAIIDGSR